MEHILNLEQVKKYYGGNSGNITKAVDGISMYVDKGEFVAIMGASGSGKTTLLNCISTIDTVTSGHITVNNQDITKIKDKDFADFRRENLGFIFQDFNLLDTLTIGENISLSLVINKQNPTDIEKRVHAIADKLGIRDILSKFPYEVSGGQKQRCACARALINEPKLILADEPTGALDSKASRLLLETMSEINKKMQATILMVTHDPFSASFCERILFLKDGKIFDKQNEKKMFRDSKKRNVIFVLSIILGAISLFLWNSRCTMDNFNKQETLTYLMVSVIMLIISIYGISTTCADMFLTVLLKNKKMKYQNDNLFVARTFASKARTMSFTFGTLSMLILISLLALNYSSINKASYDISVNLNAPYDVQLFDDKQVFDEYIRVIEEEYTIDNTIEYDIYKEPNHQVQNFFQSEYYDFDPVLKLSDYNRLLELRKMPLLSLNDNEYYIVTNSKFAYEVEDNKDIETITVANKNLKLKGYDTKSYWNSITNTGRFVVVLPDKYVQGLEVSENHLIIDTKEDTDAELENKIKEAMQHQLVKVDENGEINDESYRVNVRGAEIEQQKAMVAIVVSLFMYIAFILISAVGTILAVQSLSDSTKYKYRYLTLRRLGINDKSLFKTIRKQLLILFCVPAISAILCSFVMMSSLNNVYQQILGDKHLYLMYFGLNLIIFFLIYSIYWIATYIGFKRNINEAS
mgnify:CR=1 FL=1